MTITNIFSQLKSEHDEARALFKKCLAAKPSFKKGVISEIKLNLVPHARAEEKTLYACLGEANANKELTHKTKEGYAEHSNIDGLLSEIEEMSVDDEMWEGKFTVLRENVEHHFKEEEKTIFPEAQKYISHDLAREMLDAYILERDAFRDSCPTQKQIKPMKPSRFLSEAAVDQS